MKSIVYSTPSQIHPASGSDETARTGHTIGVDTIPLETLQSIHPDLLQQMGYDVNSAYDPGYDHHQQQQPFYPPSGYDQGPPVPSYQDEVNQQNQHIITIFICERSFSS